MDTLSTDIEGEHMTNATDPRELALTKAQADYAKLEAKAIKIRDELLEVVKENNILHQDLYLEKARHAETHKGYLWAVKVARESDGRMRELGSQIVKTERG